MCVIFKCYRFFAVIYYFWHSVVACETSHVISPVYRPWRHSHFKFFLWHHPAPWIWACPRLSITLLPKPGPIITLLQIKYPCCDFQKQETWCTTPPWQTLIWLSSLIQCIFTLTGPSTEGHQQDPISLMKAISACCWTLYLQACAAHCFWWWNDCAHEHHSLSWRAVWAAGVYQFTPTAPGDCTRLHCQSHDFIEAQRDCKYCYRNKFSS